VLLISILIAENTQKELPSNIKENIDSFRAHYPGFEHQLFDRAACQEIISKNFDREVLAAFEKLKPFAFQSDLARLCILYQQGGVYADLSVYFFSRWPPGDSAAVPTPRKLAIFRDFCNTAPWQVANTIIFAPRQHKAIGKAIDLICINVRNEFYGCSSLSPTGPDLFGKAIALTCEPEDLTTGDSVFAIPQAPSGSKQVVTEVSHCFVFLDKLHAVKRKRIGGALSELGISGGNSYNDLWVSRDIYKK
jgi:hypothetical protein